jgi:signal transduction histidine kinase
MVSLWQTLSYWGIESHLSSKEKRTILLSNRVCLLIAIFTSFLTIVSFSFFGLINSTKLGLAFALLFLTPLFLNKLGHTDASRISLAIFLSIGSLVISVVDKFNYHILEEMQYFEFRLTLLTATILPFILFDLNERKLWVSALIINLLCILLYDPIHAFFGVGYYDLGFDGPNYYFINFIVAATYLIIAASTYFLKYSFEKSEQENVDLINQLSGKQEELMLATSLVEKHRAQLEKENIQLNSSLLQSNATLTEMNHELISHNNNLQQFSYTISHNLRGPVASLQGLFSLLNQKELGESNKDLFAHFNNSIKALDSTIKDLSHIIELKNDVSSVRDKVSLLAELTQIKTLLQREIIEQEVTITHEFGISEFESVKPMVHSILYNLISNAIKYRSYERPLIITLRSQRIGKQIQIEVQDNGLGIDLVQYKEKLFGLYKRFHSHTEGKGLGLFLVKLQVESLGGSIKVSSKPGVGSTFTILLEPEDH